MAEKKKDDKKKDSKKPEAKKHHNNKGELSFGIEIILFMVALFILWAMFSKPSSNIDKPFIKEQTINTLPE